MSGDDKRYGVDVALTRADDLDKKLECAVIEGCAHSVLDVGSGAGGQSNRLVALGADVTAIDIVDYAGEFGEQVAFIQADMREIVSAVEGRCFDAALVQRTIHYLRYSDALQFLEELRMLVDKLYISVTGLDSDIGRGYSEAGKPVTDRFARLHPNDQKTFSITEPVCLYSETEFMQLLQDAGWEIEEFWISAFGNIKAVCASSRD